MPKDPNRTINNLLRNHPTWNEDDIIGWCRNRLKRPRRVQGRSRMETRRFSKNYYREIIKIAEGIIVNNKEQEDIPW